MSNAPRRFAADTSTVINLIATGRAEEILRAFPYKIIITDIVAREVEDGRKKGHEQADLLRKLINAQLIRVEKLTQANESVFERLVVGSAFSTLDDGEAATIAYAAEHSIGVLVDERKARRICQEQFKGLQLQCSVDVFQDATVKSALGAQALSDAVLSALQGARMRVLPEHLDWVTNLIGQEKAKLCPSLPRRHPTSTASKNKRV